MDLYIYYRVHVRDTQALQEKVGRMQAALRRQHGLMTALKRRPEPQGEYTTWMEVYSAIPTGFDDILASAALQSELAMLIDGERHKEYFLDLPPCA